MAILVSIIDGTRLGATLLMQLLCVHNYHGRLSHRYLTERCSPQNVDILNRAPQKCHTHIVTNMSKPILKRQFTSIQTTDEIINVDLKNFFGHTDEVNCATFSPDFELLVTGSDDKTVRVFNAASGRFVVSLPGHKGPVRSVAISPNSKYFASGDYCKKIHLWRTRDGSCLFILEGHTKSVECLTFSSDSELLCSGSWDRTAIVWDVETGKQLRSFEGHINLVQSVGFSFSKKWLATGSWDYTVRLWNLEVPVEPSHVTPDGDAEENGEERKPKNVRTLHGHKGNIHAVAFSKEDMLASGSWDRTIRLWNPRTAVCLFVLKGHKGWVQAVAFSSDSLFLVSACEDDTVRVWDCTLGKCVQVLEGKTDTVTQCGFGAQRAILVAGSAHTTLTRQTQKT